MTEFSTLKGVFRNIHLRLSAVSQAGFVFVDHAHFMGLLRYYNLGSSHKNAMLNKKIK